MFRITSALVLCIFASSLNCSEDDQLFNLNQLRAVVKRGDGRIIGGREVSPHSVKFQVGLRINGQAFCGGAIISPKFVLTAAHCGEVISTVDVILGAHNISNANEPGQTVIRGRNVTVHEKYVSQFYTNDIALIELERPVIFNQYIQPAKLPSPTDSKSAYTGRQVVATGWGLVEDVPFPGINHLSKVLIGVNLTVIPLKDCEEYYNDDKFIYVTSSNICTSGYRNKGTCNGDSGGPLVLNGTVVGLTSFGTTECELCSPSVYTGVVDYLDWIRKHTGI